MKSRLQKDLVIPKELGSLSSLVAVLNEWILWPGVKHQLANTWRQAEGLDKLCHNGCLCRTSQCKAFCVCRKGPFPCKCCIAVALRRNTWHATCLHLRP